MSENRMIPWRKGSRKLALAREDEPFMALQDEINRMFNHFMESPFDMDFWRTPAMRDFSPQLDVSETEKEIKITVELPGLEQKDISISLLKDVLTISGEKKVEEEAKDRNYYRIERRYGSFQRSVPLPARVEEDKVEAVFKNGVLVVTLPKKESEVSATRRIDIKSD